MGLFRRTQSESETRTGRLFRIEMGWRGLLGLIAVCFCLYLWMFLLGIWAGQTILLPPRGERIPRSAAEGPPAETLQQDTPPPIPEARDAQP